MRQINLTVISKRYWLVALLCIQVLAGMAQTPVCTSPPTPGKAAVSSTVLCAGNTLNFSLSGNSSGDGIQFQWQVATSLSGPFTNVGAAQTDPAFTTGALEGVYYYRAGVMCSGNWQYSDTLTVTGVGVRKLFGHYTINATLPTSTSNFTSFSAALAALVCGGVSGAVVFDVTSTNVRYSEQLIIPEIQGASADNTITFNGNGNTIAFASNAYDQEAVIKLNGADHFIFDSLQIDATGGSYGYGVQLINNADSNIVRRCNINVGNAYTSTNYAGVVINASDSYPIGGGDGSMSDGNVFERNSVVGGYYGMTMIGGWNANAVIKNNSFINNDVRDFHLFGIYVEYTDGAVIAGNSISRPQRNNPVTFYGVYMTGNNTNTLISGNRLFNPFGTNSAATSAAYGIYLDGTDATSAAPNVISNNLLYNFNGAGSVYGIYNSSSDYAFCYHNTLSFDNTANTSTNLTRGYYEQATVIGAEFKNNIVTITRGGGGPNHCIYMSAMTNVVASDNNDFYVGSAATNYVGFKGSSQATLANWQTASGGDAASLSVDPLYLRIAEDNYKPNSALLDNKGVPVGVTQDIAGAARSTTTPDIGAYEFTPVGCTNPPAAATVISSDNPICAAGSVKLSVRGGDLGSNLTYQWQSSADSSSWINITATGIDATVSQIADTYYRVVSTCATGGTTPSAGLLIRTLMPTKGVFTINRNVPTGGTNFASFNDAWNAIKCGISGPVVFNVEPSSGPYNEQLIMTEVSGASAVNTITFNGNSNSITYTSTNSNERAVVKLNGADHVIIDGLVIKATGSTSAQYGFGLQLTNNSDSNIVRRCTILTDSTMGSFNYAGIVVNGSASDATVGSADCDYNLFEDNTVNGGYYSMTLAGTNAIANMGNIIRRNRFMNFYNYGFYNASSYQTVIDSNVISRPTRTSVGDFQGIYMTGSQTKTAITRNRITNPFGGSPAATNNFYGITFNAADAISSLENVVSNNVLYNITGAGTVYGLYNYTSDRVWYYHNTINLDGAAAAGGYYTYGFYQEEIAVGLRFNNNIITISRSSDGPKYALYYSTVGSVINSDYNNLYISATDGSHYIGYDGTNHKILAAWQQTTHDVNSTSSDPKYKDVANGNLEPVNADIDNRGKPEADVVPLDINNKTRSTTTPDLGAYEFDPPVCTSPPVAGTSTTSAAELCENGTVELNLAGNGTGSTQTYQWEVSTSLTGTYAPVSSVQTNPLFTIVATETRYYRGTVTCNGVTSYATPVKINVNGALPGGVYVIDTNGTGNFRNFTEAKAALSCGIKGPVVFNVKPGSGTYNEQLSLDSTIAGLSAINTITFNGNGNTLHYSSSDNDNRAVITLNGAHYITFDSLKINAEGDGGYGWGVFLTNNADNNTFRNCIIQIPLSATTQEYAGVVIGSSPNDPLYVSATSACDNNLFQHNTIIGGFMGISMPAQSTDLMTGNQFTGNNITDFHYYGILIGTSDKTLVEDNVISRPTRTNLSTFTGIYVTGNSNNLVISKNRIHTSFGGDSTIGYASYGISVNYDNAPNDKPTVVSNNLVYNFNGQGEVYGCYTFFSSNVHFYHNTISLDAVNYNGANASYGFYQYLQASSIDIRNNVVTLTRGGTGNRYGIYFTLQSTFTSDNNDVWLGTPGTGKYWGGMSSNKYSTLADWQLKTTTDAHSYTADPLYENFAANDFKPQVATLDNTGAPVGITTDVLDVIRSSTKPDIGAYEFSTTPCTSPPTPGTATVTPATGICMGTTVKFSLTDNSVGGFQKYVWQRAPSADGPWTNISDTADVPDLMHELASPNAFFRAIVMCGTGIAYSTPVQVGLNPYLLAGDYTIDPAQAMGGKNFQSFNQAVAAMACGIQGTVRFLAVPGTYNERVLIPKIPGVSDTATVTFLSRDNDAKGVILTAACTMDSNYVLKLDTTNYIGFKNITISATGTNYGRAVELTGESSKDTITGCIIQVPTTASVAMDVAGIYGSGLRGLDNVITKNTVSNGAAGIYLSGTPELTQRYVVDSNSVSGSYFYNIYLENLNRLSVSGNTITKAGLQNISTYGIYVANSDSTCRINQNNVSIANTGVTAYGIYLTASEGNPQRESSIWGNKIKATSNNTGSLYGMYVWGVINMNIMNNVIEMGTAGDVAYGIYNTVTGNVSYYNNSVQNATPGDSSLAAYFANVDRYRYDRVNPLEVYNNVFSNTGGGPVISLAYPEYVRSDYNLFYTSGPGLLKFQGLIGDPLNRFTICSTLKQWQDTVYSDYHSLVYKPAFVSGTALEPDVNSAEVWAMQGRGIQIAVDTTDINGNKRATTLTTGVPDLGAYEFVPIAEPMALTAIPAKPAPNSTQTFMLGTDTVTRITWGSVVPATIEGKRYSGVEPGGLATGQAHMFFYTSFTTTGTAPTGHRVQQLYLDPWRGFINDERTTKLGETDASAVWNVSGTSRVDTLANVLSDSNLTVLNKFTGLTDGKISTPPIVINITDTSNLGKQFWLGYGHNHYFESDSINYSLVINSQKMVLYLGATAQEAHVTVRVNGTTWIRNYTVPANTVLTTDEMPKYGIWDSRLLTEGWSDHGISIESDVPIAAYAHLYSDYNSGATMLMPVGTYGYEYYALTSKQNYGPNAHSWFYVVAAYDSTVVEITPSVPTLGGRPAGVPFTVHLQKGEVYQVLGLATDISNGYDVTGSKIRSIGNDNGKCYPIGVFSGSSETNVSCGFATPYASGDYLIQQNTPYRSWGKRYLTAPSSQSGNVSLVNGNIYKVLVKDPATVVKRNGTVLTGLVDNLYYQIETPTADYIEADKPILVAQFLPSSSGSECGYTGDGDPEMIYLSPLEQGLKSVALARTTNYAITSQFVTLIIADGGLSSLTIDGSKSYSSYAHPNMPGYTVVMKRWDATNGQTVIKSDSSFTGITYGFGESESYGFNMGTKVAALDVKTLFTNADNPLAGQHTCAGTTFKLKILSLLQPTEIEWLLDGIPGLQPAGNVTVTNPVATDTLIINGLTYYEYTLTPDHSIDVPGDYTASVVITHPDIDACDQRLETLINIHVDPAPVVDFAATGDCVGSAVQFKGSAELTNNTAIATWAWNFDDAGAVSAAQDTVHTYAKAGTYQVKLSVIDQNGCTADTVKPVSITAVVAAPVVKIESNSPTAVTFSWAAVDGATGYEVSLDNGVTWTEPSSGPTGLTHTLTGLQLGQSVTIKVRALGGCMPAESEAVTITTAVDEVFIPNSFTPDNGLAENQTFRVYGSSIQTLRLMIFNQWGEKIFESNTQNQGWDGRYKGKPQPSGVYIYVVDITLINNKQVNKKGSVNLIR